MAYQGVQEGWLTELANDPTESTFSKERVETIFARCLDCDKYHDLLCDIAVALETKMSAEDFRRSVDFPVEHNGDRLSAKAERAGG